MIYAILRYLGLKKKIYAIMYEHTIGMLLTILSFKVIFEAAKWGIVVKETLECFERLETFAFLGLVAWFLYQMGISLWNNRKRIRGNRHGIPLWIFGA